MSEAKVIKSNKPNDPPEASALFRILIALCALGGMCLTLLAMGYSSGMRSFGAPTRTPIGESIFFLSVFLGFVGMPIAVATKNRILSHITTLITAPLLYLTLVLPIVILGFIPWYLWYFKYIAKRKFPFVFLLIPLVLAGVFYAFKFNFGGK